VSVKVSSNELIYFRFAGGVEVLELVDSLELHNIETIRKYTIWLSLEQVFALIGRNVGYGGENIRAVSSRSFDAISMVDSPLSSFVIDVKILKIVVEVDGAGTQVTTKKGCMCSKDSGNVDMTFATKGDCKTSLPLVEVGNDSGGQLPRDILHKKF